MAYVHAEESPNFKGQGAGREPGSRPGAAVQAVCYRECNRKRTAPALAGVRVKRRCKRPPGMTVMPYAMKTSPKQGQIRMLFPARERRVARPTVQGIALNTVSG